MLLSIYTEFLEMDDISKILWEILEASLQATSSSYEGIIYSGNLTQLAGKWTIFISYAFPKKKMGDIPAIAMWG